MTKNRRTAPPNPPRVSRTTMEVDPAWLETEEGRRSIASKLPGDRASRTSRTSRTSDGGRATIDVQPEWLESGAKPPPLPETDAARGKKKPPPLPEPDEPVGRSAIPPPLPPTTKRSAGNERGTTGKKR